MTDLDIDIWGYGRNAAHAGCLDNQMLRACYPYVEFSYKDELKIQKILKENFELDHNGVRPYLLRFSYVFFQTKEDAEFFQGLLYLY